MAGSKQLGLFFGSSGICLAECQDKKTPGHYYMPYQTNEQQELLGNVSDEIKLTATLQKALRDNKIETRDVSVSLPTSEFIIRTFSMPLLAKEETAPAVEFEVRKYIPFKLEELFFDYQVNQFTEGRQKKTKVLFVGVKRNVLERYIYIIQQAELKISCLEPHAFSLLRLFIAKRVLALGQTAVIIDTSLSEGTIMIVEQGLPQLIRDFKLNAAPSNGFTQDPDAEFSHLLNEVRISLEYYRRLNPKGNIQRIIFSSDDEVKQWSENLSKEMRMPCTAVSAADVLGLKEKLEPGLLVACGAGLLDMVKTSLSVNLARKRFKQEPRITKAMIEEAIPTQLIVKSVVVALILIGLLSSFNITKIINLGSQLSVLKRTSGEFGSLSEEDLKSMIASYEKKIQVIQQAASSNLVAPNIFAVPLTLPEGAWLTSLSIKFENPENKSINLRGIVYSADANTELDLVNKLILNLKQSTEIGSNFKKIALVTATQSRAKEGGTNFEVMCR